MNRYLMLFFALFMVETPACWATSIRVKQGELTAEARLEPAYVSKMSQLLELTLTIEGPSPLEVTVPKPLLTTPSEWRVFDRELPTREVLPNGRQRWQRRYQLSPLKLGEVALRPAKFMIRAGNQPDTLLDWGDELLHVKVDTAVKNATVDSLRDPTTIEQLPPASTVPISQRSWLIGVVPVCIGVAVLLLLLGRRPRVSPVIHDAAWASAELEANPSADHCAFILREYLGGRLGSDFRSSTTAELMGKIPTDLPWSAELRDNLRRMLEQCDRVRFSGEPSPTPLWLVPAKEWIAQLESNWPTTST